MSSDRNDTVSDTWTGYCAVPDDNWIAPAPPETREDDRDRPEDNTGDEDRDCCRLRPAAAASERTAATRAAFIADAEREGEVEERPGRMKHAEMGKIEERRVGRETR